MIITTTNAVKKYTVAAVTLAIGITAIAMTVAMKGEYVEKSISGYQINDHLWEGSYFPRLPDGSRKKFNVYAKTREECEKELAKMIEAKKKEIAKLKKKAKTA